jgi:Glycosyltransferase family 87
MAESKIRGKVVTNFIRTEFAKTSASRLIFLIWIGGLIGVLLHSVFLGGYVANSHGRPLPGEFLAIWSAGQMMAQGNAAGAYDSYLLHQQQVMDVGYPFAGHFMWLFPPLFLLVAVALAQLPFVAAYAFWAFATLAAYLACVRRLFQNRSAALAFGLSPAAFLTFIIAQNGLFIAALFGAALVTLRTKPIISGVFFAALVIKPQFGLLVPVALIAGGHWRAMLTASLASIAWVVAWFALDPALIQAFVNSLIFARRELLTMGHQDWHKLQSIYALVRIVGLTDGWSSVLALALGTVLMGIVFWAWRSSLSHSLKAAILLLSALGASPYLYIYDFPLLTIAIGFLFSDQEFDRFETTAILVAYSLTILSVVILFPFGPFAIAAVASIVARRVARIGHDTAFRQLSRRQA